MKIERETHNQPRLQDMMFEIEKPQPFDARLDIRSEDLKMLIKAFNAPYNEYGSHYAIDNLALLRILSMAMERARDFVPNPLCFSDKHLQRILGNKVPIGFASSYHYLQRASFIKIINTTFFPEPHSILDFVSRSFVEKGPYYGEYLEQCKILNILSTTQKPPDTVSEDILEELKADLQGFRTHNLERYFSLLATFRLAFPSDFKKHRTSFHVPQALLRDTLNTLRQEKRSIGFLRLAANATIVTAEDIIMDKDAFELIPGPLRLPPSTSPLPVLRNF